MASDSVVRRLCHPLLFFALLFASVVHAEEIELTKASIADLQTAMEKGALT
jgi:hypothetical protein